MRAKLAHAGHPCFCTGAYGWEWERTAPPTVLDFKVRWKLNGLSRRPQDTWREGQSAPHPTRSKSHVPTVRRRR